MMAGKPLVRPGEYYVSRRDESLDGPDRPLRLETARGQPLADLPRFLLNARPALVQIVPLSLKGLESRGELPHLRAVSVDRFLRELVLTFSVFGIDLLESGEDRVLAVLELAQPAPQPFRGYRPFFAGQPLLCGFYVGANRPDRGTDAYCTGRHRYGWLS